MHTALVTLVGYLVPFASKPGVVVWCDGCASGKHIDHTLSMRAIPLYKENVGIYRQDCHICGKVMVRQNNPSWMVLGRQLYPNMIPALPKAE